MEKLIRTTHEAAGGSATAAASLQAFGLQAQQMVSLKPDEQFMRVADALQGLGTQGERTAAVMALFGKSGGGGELLATLDLGSDGMRRMSAEALALGIAVSRADAAMRTSVTDRAARLIAAGLMPLSGLKPDVTLQFHIAAVLLDERPMEPDDLVDGLVALLASMSPRTRRPIRFIRRS